MLRRHQHYGQLPVPGLKRPEREVLRGRQGQQHGGGVVGEQLGQGAHPRQLLLVVAGAGVMPVVGLGRVRYPVGGQLMVGRVVVVVIVMVIVVVMMRLRQARQVQMLLRGVARAATGPSSALRKTTSRVVAVRRTEAR